MSPSRRPLTAARLAELRRDLTDRELAALQMIRSVHAATTDQVARTVFAGQAQASAARLARRHLQRLARFGLVRRFIDRSRYRGAGHPATVHALTSAGLRLTGGQHGLGVRQRRLWRPTPGFLAHRLAIAELFVRLAEQAHRGGPVVRQFFAEPDGARTYEGPAGERLTIRPDATIRLVTGKTELSWFVEVDRDTETRPATIAGKCRSYRLYELSGHEQRRYGVFPGVLFIVPTSQRAHKIRQVIRQQPPDAQDLFTVATEEDALTILSSGEVQS